MKLVQWELYHKQFEAATAHNQWIDMDKAVALTLRLKKPAPQVLTALPYGNIIEYATLNCLEQRFWQKHHAPMKRQELKNCIQKSREGLQNYAADIRRLTQNAYSSMNPESVKSVTVHSSIDNIHYCKVQ